MIIGIVGLGLIGGSLARAFTTKTEHIVYGTDQLRSVALAARMIDATAEELTEDRIGDCDYIFVSLYPKAAIDWIREHAHRIRKDAIVADTCGVKGLVCEAVKPISEEYGFTFIGAHPMAGAAESGFGNSKDSLFVKTPMILCPYSGTDVAVVDRFRRLLNEIGISRTPIFTPEKHDEMIAYTSQLTHVMANAYIRTEKSMECKGCTGGSFRDATRVAKLNADMWTSLCMDNKEALLKELQDFKMRMAEYETALKNNDADTLKALFAAGTDYKLRNEKQ